MLSENSIVKISKEIISTLPVVAFDGEIVLVDTPEGVNEAVAYLQQHKIIGFDTETKPSFKKGKPNKVALMQLSTLERCYLIRLNAVGMTAALRALIENGDVLKIGLSVHDDFNVMHRSSEFEPQGFLDLQKYVSRFRISDISLQKIYAIIFGKKISKSQRLTNWEAPALTPGQQVYAATDAWACLQIYNHLEAGLFDPATSPYLTEPEC